MCHAPERLIMEKSTKYANPSAGNCLILSLGSPRGPGWVWGRFWTRAVLSGVPARYGVLTNGDELDWIDADIEFRLFLEAPCHHNWQLRKNIFSYRKNFKFFLGHIVSLKSSKIKFYGNPTTDFVTRLPYIVLGNLAKIRKTLTYSNGLDHI